MNEDRSFGLKWGGLNRMREGGWGIPKCNTCPQGRQVACQREPSGRRFHTCLQRGQVAQREKTSFPKEGHMSWEGMTCVSEDTCLFGE